MKMRRNAGFTLVEIMIVVAIIGVLCAIGAFSYNKARATAQTNGCLNNLTQMDRAKFMWALEQGKGALDVPADSDLFGAGSFIKQKPVCPGGGTYTLGIVLTNTTCSIPSHILP